MTDRSAIEIREYLRKLSVSIREIEDSPIQDFAGKLAVKGLKSEENLLFKELKAVELIESLDDAEAVFDGASIQNQKVQIKFFGEFLIYFQELSNAVAQGLTDSNSGSGTLPKSLIEDNRLMLAQTFAGSFGARFQLAPHAPHLFADMDEYKFNATPLEIVTSLLDGSLANEAVIQQLSHPRVKAHYSQLVNLLASTKNTLNFRTRLMPYGVQMTSAQASERAIWIDSLRTTTDYITLEGKLTGGSIHRKRFELTLASGQVLEGRVVEGAIRQLEKFHFGDTVEASIEVTIVKHEEITSEKTSYFLTAVSTLSGSLFEHDNSVALGTTR